MQTRGSANIFGLDLSEYQTITNAADLFADYPNYIYLRSYGTSGSPDPKFIERVNLAKSYNVPSGAYYFCTPTKALGAGGEAECDFQCDQFISHLYQAYGSNNCGDLIPMLDCEAWGTTTPQRPMYTLTGLQVRDWVARFRDRFYTTTKRRLGFYSNRYFLTDPTQLGLTAAQLDPLKNMPLWLAEYDEYYPNNTIDTNAPANLGGWTTYALWQYAVLADADQHGLSHGENKVDHNRTDSVDRIKPPPPPLNVSAVQTADNQLTINFTRPNITDYIGASVYVNGAWKAWVASSATSDLAVIDITNYSRNVDATYQVIAEDSYSDFGNSEIETIRLFTTKAESELNIMPVASMGTTLKKGTTTVAELTSIDGVSVSMDTVETTTLDTVGGYRTFINGLKDAGEVSISGHFAYASHNTMMVDFESGASASYTIEFPDKAATTGTKWTFTAIVTAFGTSVDLEDLISFEATLKISGKPTLSAPA